MVSLSTIVGFFSVFMFDRVMRFAMYAIDDIEHNKISCEVAVELRERYACVTATMRKLRTSFCPLRVVVVRLHDVYGSDVTDTSDRQLHG